MSEPYERDADRTRARLLRAARMRFRTYSFEDVTLRDVASDVGVNAALIIRYFGGKEALYRQVLASVPDGSVLLAGPREGFGDRVARAVLEPRMGAEVTDGLLILLRAIGSPHALAAIQDSVGTWEGLLRDWIDLPDANERAFLISSVLLGVALKAELTNRFENGGATIQNVRPHLARTLQSYLDPHWNRR